MTGLTEMIGAIGILNGMTEITIGEVMIGLKNEVTVEMMTEATIETKTEATVEMKIEALIEMKTAILIKIVATRIETTTTDLNTVEIPAEDLTEVIVQMIGVLAIQEGTFPLLTTLPMASEGGTDQTKKIRNRMCLILD